MSPKIINNEQYDYWNSGIGQKWVKEDNSLNERFTILTKELFSRASINKNDKVQANKCLNGQIKTKPIREQLKELKVFYVRKTQ